MLKTIILLLALTAIPGEASHRVKRIVGGMRAEAPPVDDPVVFVHQPTKTIRIEGLQQDFTGFYSFLGIPYADPPTGRNRFVKARLRKLFGDVQATRYPSPCPQPSSKNPQDVIGDEDCLKLNIHTPRMPDEEEKLPVIVFLHGGGFRYGSPSQYDPRHFIGHKVIFVGVQYRLGSLGILGLGSKEFPSNGALSDCVAALRWTHRYIQYFGGDAQKVTVLGHGSGAALAMMLSLSRHSNPLIRGIVAMSGSALSPHAVDGNPKKSLLDVEKLNRCAKESPLKIFRCLQNVALKEIIRSDSDIQFLPKNSDIIADLSGFLGFSPSVEDADDNRGLPGILTEPPRNALQAGHFNSKIRLLIGQTKDETCRASALTKIPANTLKKLQDDADSFLSIFNLTCPKDFFSQLSSALVSLGNIPKNLFNNLIQSTTDIFFSIPMIFTAEFWSHTAQSFIYSFDFLSKSKLPGGEIFLPQLALTQGVRVAGNVAHGDELIFLFEPRDVFGNSLGNFSASFAPADEKVRRDFTEMIVKFTRIGDDGENSTDVSIFMPFTTKKLPYIEISDTISLKDNFRICSLINFGGIFSFVDNIQCEIVKTAGGLAEGVVDTVSGAGKYLAKVTYLDKVFG
ncbi:venom carboxylesterase-6 [Phlebotomus argentipes]|uniref:venom carboxylesterase-6 n=1 Tax=Phlebotomus argentipes TaxID=94469 RepID=UPI0028936224|nr:venom carboxylesterase-6 [Phlebotomus argentipes]